MQLRLAEAVNGRAAEDAFERFTLAIFDWLAAEAHKPSSPARLEAIAGLWRKLRDQTRETLTFNLDKRLHVIALFEEIRCAREGAERLIAATNERPPCSRPRRGRACSLAEMRRG